MPSRPNRLRPPVNRACACAHRRVRGHRPGRTDASLAPSRRAEKRTSTCRRGIASPAEIARAARGCDVVFHAAGIAALHAPLRVLRWVHVAGTENVLKAARHAGVRRVVYGSCADVSLVDEDRMHWDEQRSLPELPVGPHARSQLMAEELALAASDDQLEVTALRPAMLWGPDDVDGMLGFARAVEGGSFALYSGGRNLIATTHIDNLARAALADRDGAGRAGPRLLWTDASYEAREFYGRLASASYCLLPAAIGRSARAAAGTRRDACRGGGRGPGPRWCAGRSALFDVSQHARSPIKERRPDARFADWAAWSPRGRVAGLGTVRCFSKCRRRDAQRRSRGD